MRHTVVFQRQSTTQDGAGQPIATWTELGRTVASVAPISGREFLTQSGEHSDITHRVTFRGQKGLTLRPDDQMIFGSRVFDIRSALDMGERGREIQVMCVERLST